jgi:16S rRNA processing protein RimM
VTLLTIATLSGPRGVRGEAKLRPVNTPPYWLDTVKRVKLSLPTQTLWVTVNRWQWKDPFVLAFFEELPTREAVALWAKAAVEAEEADLPQLDDDSFRAKDLEGKPVWSEKTGQQVATVVALMFHGDNPFLKLQHGEQDWLIPFQTVFIPRIEPDKLWLSIDLADLG